MINPNFPLDIAMISLGFAIFWYLADTPWLKLIGKWMFLIVAFIATFSAWTLDTSQTWISDIWIGQLGLMFILLWLDVIMPVVTFFQKGRRG